MNKFWVGPRGIGGNAFLLRIAEKALIRGLQKDGMKKLRTAVLNSTVGVSKDCVRCKRWGKSITNFCHMQVNGYFLDINQIYTNKRLKR